MINLNTTHTLEPMTMDEVRRQLDGIVDIVSWSLFGGLWVEVKRSKWSPISKRLVVTLTAEGDWQGWSSVAENGTDADLERAILAAYHELDVTRDAVKRARRYA
jgi:hypothetical protein